MPNNSTNLWTRRAFLQRAAASAVGASALASAYPYPENALQSVGVYPARALGLTSVYSAPLPDSAHASLHSGMIVGHLAPDSVHQVTELPIPDRITPHWLHMEHGFVSYAAMQPMWPGTGYTPLNIPEVPAVYEICVPAAPVRAYAAGNAPIRRVLGYGAVYGAEDRLRDMRGVWWIKLAAQQRDSADGEWVQATHCVMSVMDSKSSRAPDPTLHAVLNASEGSLCLYAGRKQILRTAFCLGTHLPVRFSPGQEMAITRLFPAPPDAIDRCWLIGFDGGFMRGIWWHNRFDGFPATASGGQRPALVADSALIDIPYYAARSIIALVTVGRLSATGST